MFSVPGHPPMAIDVQELAALRETQYNAELVERIDIHPELFRIRVRPDHGMVPFEPGQYVALGLGYWEPRIQPSQDESLTESRWRKVVKRAYSISCPLCDSSGTLITCADVDYLEFYVTLVRHATAPDGRPPALTPRLFMMQPGDRLHIEHRITGHYTLNGVNPQDNVVLISTGTGEAPHNAMIAQLLRHGHRGKILNLTTVRSRVDLGYINEHQTLMTQFPNYHYHALSTRDPENLDPNHPHYVGKQYVQDLFVNGRLSELIDTPLDPLNTHVFLCGNPAMIGIAKLGHKAADQPGMLQLLQQAGFTNPDPGPGHIRYEKYW